MRVVVVVVVVVLVLVVVVVVVAMMMMPVCLQDCRVMPNLVLGKVPAPEHTGGNDRAVRVRVAGRAEVAVVVVAVPQQLGGRCDRRCGWS